MSLKFLKYERIGLERIRPGLDTLGGTMFEMQTCLKGMSTADKI
jgi:hypothetical protein